MKLTPAQDAAYDLILGALTSYDLTAADVAEVLAEQLQALPVPVSAGILEVLVEGAHADAIAAMGGTAA